jgi:hypothetical protein
MLGDLSHHTVELHKTEIEAAATMQVVDPSTQGRKIDRLGEERGGESQDWQQGPKRKSEIDSSGMRAGNGSALIVNVAQLQKKKRRRRGGRAIRSALEICSMHKAIRAE